MRIIYVREMICYWRDLGLFVVEVMVLLSLFWKLLVRWSVWIRVLLVFSEMVRFSLMSRVMEIFLFFWLFFSCRVSFLGI